MIIPTPPERIEQIQEALRTRVAATTAAKAERSIANEAPVRAVGEGDLIEFPKDSGRWFVVPPVSYPDALVIQRLVRDEKSLRAEIRDRGEMGNTAMARLLELHEETTTMLRKLVRPVRFWDRVMWRLSPRNPFRFLTTMEVGQLLLFFYGLTMRSRVLFSSTSLEERAARQTAGRAR
jgi:hypothetical protein